MTHMVDIAQFCCIAQRMMYTHNC